VSFEEVPTPTEKELESIAKVGSYVELFSQYVAPILKAAQEAEDPGEEMTSLSIALLTVAHISMQPFSEEDRASIDAAAGSLFDVFYEQVLSDAH
jgi:hypothetical protein